LNIVTGIVPYQGVSLTGGFSGYFETRNFFFEEDSKGLSTKVRIYLKGIGILIGRVRNRFFIS
jgi:hypothetical protein